MKIQFIGTGSGKTSLKRYHSSFLLSEDNKNILVDCGDGISRALLTQNINFTEIDSIIISHLHPDHYTGLPLLISQMKMEERTGELKIYVHDSLITFVQKFITQSYLFEAKLGFKISYVPFNHGEEFLADNIFHCLSKQNTHLDKYAEYAVDKSLNLISCGFLFRTEKTSIFYTGDMGGKNDLTLFSSGEYEYLISEITHISFDDVISLIDCDKLTKIFLTHISDEDEQSVINFIMSLPPVFRNKFIAAYDGCTANL